ncbi:molecular chaperone Hsp33 [Lachnospiraceae bacterium]|nr:molecular chaperone Hsp33 [Lachnospiraceae bacterium]
MNDYMVRAMSKNGDVRIFAATTRNTVEEARKAHNTSPVISAALGRLLTGGAMMGAMLKGDDMITLQIRGDGPVKGLTVTADARGHVKGFALEPEVIVPIRESDHKLDVGKAVGHGTLQIIKDLGLKDPYIGQTALVNGEIAEDLTYYFASSEQVPSAVGLGVLMNHDNTVREAGGFIVQMLPGASEESISAVEKNVAKIHSVTDLLKEGNKPEDIIRLVLDGLEPKIFDPMPVEFKCDCGVEKVSRVLISIGEAELNKLIEEGEPVEIRCEFCGKAYTFSVDDVKELLAEAKKTGNLRK